MRTHVSILVLVTSLMLATFAEAGEFRNAYFTCDVDGGYFHPFTSIAPHKKNPGNFTFGINPGVSFKHLSFNLGLGYETFATDERNFVHETKVQNLLVDITVRWNFFYLDPVRLYLGGGINSVFQGVKSPFLKTTAIGYEEALHTTTQSGFGPMAFFGLEAGNDNHAFFFQVALDSYFGLPDTLVAVRPTVGYRITL